MMLLEDRVKAAYRAEKAAKQAEDQGLWGAAAAYREEYRALMTGMPQFAGPLPIFDAMRCPRCDARMKGCECNDCGQYVPKKAASRDLERVASG